MSFLSKIPKEILDQPDPPPAAEPWRDFESNSLAQAQALESWAPKVGYSGRLGSSKSRTCCEGALWDAVFWRRNRVLLARKRSTDLFATTAPIFFEETLPPKWLKGWRPSAPGAPTLFLPNKSQILFIGLDEPMKIKSGQYGSIYVDQAEDLDDLERDTAESRIRHRVRPTLATEQELRELDPTIDDETLKILLRTGVPLRARIVYAFNPDGDHHWGNVEFKFRQMQELPAQHANRWHRKDFTDEPVKLLSERVVPAGHLLREAIIARPTDNTQNLSERYLLGLAQKVGAWKRRFVDGEWGTFEGQVLPNFREHVHVIDRPEEWDAWGSYPPPTWKRFRAVDFGYGPGHPFVMQWWARRPRTKEHPAKDFLYQEIYWTGRLVSEHAKTAHRWDAEEVAATNRGVARWLAANQEAIERGAARPLRELKRLDFSGQWRDHDAEDGATLDSCGIIMDEAVKDRLPGAQIVAERLGEDGAEPRIAIVRTARRELDPVLAAEGGKRPTCTFEELSGIRWLKKTSSEERGQKEDWVKDMDDGFDAMRYFLLSERERGSMSILM